MVTKKSLSQDFIRPQTMCLLGVMILLYLLIFHTILLPPALCAKLAALGVGSFLVWKLILFSSAKLQQSADARKRRMLEARIHLLGIAPELYRSLSLEELEENIKHLPAAREEAIKLGLQPENAATAHLKPLRTFISQRKSVLGQ